MLDLPTASIRKVGRLSLFFRWWARKDIVGCIGWNDNIHHSNTQKWDMNWEKREWSRLGLSFLRTWRRLILVVVLILVLRTSGRCKVGWTETASRCCRIQVPWYPQTLQNDADKLFYRRSPARSALTEGATTTFWMVRGASFSEFNCLVSVLEQARSWKEIMR